MKKEMKNVLNVALKPFFMVVNLVGQFWKVLMDGWKFIYLFCFYFIKKK